MVGTAPRDQHTVYCTQHGRTYRLPGPLALVQTEGTGTQRITHINALSLGEIEAACPAVTAEELAAAADGSTAGALLTTISRDGVTVRALTVVAVHAGLLGGAGPAGPPSAAAAGGDSGSADADAAAERRALLRAAARLTWGLAGLVFELMHRQAGHWPSLGAVERQGLAGAALTQLYNLNRGLALGVLRAYGQLTPERFDEMLEHGLLPQPAAAPAAPADAPADACTGQQEGEAGVPASGRHCEEGTTQV
ncbi:beta-glucosidase [Chlorella sorokiniana]|uniref:Beta-glucosidase n=1 Tax=Chlorella sorokiniana TaxID=3076 RepID=A0A2P6TMH8_CHLSO|nr:beta-glucosidase [Chlorella sorokiniana]|eukprot:PRW45548.1 beta-glucosidase [Chlorella sorokiniana]